MRAIPTRLEIAMSVCLTVMIFSHAINVQTEKLLAEKFQFVY